MIVSRKDWNWGKSLGWQRGNTEKEGHIIIIVNTRPKPAYPQQGLAGGTVLPRYRSSGKTNLEP